MKKKAQAGPVLEGHFTAFRKHLADYNNLQIVSAYQILILNLIPFIFQRRIFLYNSLTKKYYEFEDNVLEKRLLKIMKGYPSEYYLRTIKEYEKTGKIKFKPWIWKSENTLG